MTGIAPKAFLSRYTRAAPQLRLYSSSVTPSLPSPRLRLLAATGQSSASQLLLFPPPSSSPSTFSGASFSQTRTMATELRFRNPAIFVCDLQEKFRTAIYEFDSIVTTTEKLLTFAKSLSIPIHATTQTSAKLGPTIPSIAALLTSAPHDKTKFSMFVPAIASTLSPGSRIALVGIESHICITQTALDLRDAGHFPYVIADAVSSCNQGEVLVALDRLRSEAGITVTTSESWMYECLGDASHPAFKGLIGVVKSSLGDTTRILKVLPPASKM